MGLICEMVSETMSDMWVPYTYAMKLNKINSELQDEGKIKQKIIVTFCALSDLIII